jgi:hypothetical protein
VKIGNPVYAVLATILFTLALPDLLPAIQSQDDNGDVDEEDLSPTGQVVNSKNLVLSGVTFNEDENQANIAGMILNNSTDQSFTNVSGIGQLYDGEQVDNCFFRYSRPG